MPWTEAGGRWVHVRGDRRRPMTEKSRAALAEALAALDAAVRAGKEGAPDMRITQLSYRRVANLGRYETATIEATASVDEGESPAEALEALRDFVKGQLGLMQPAPAGDGQHGGE